jgi:hypothetical protein
MASNQTLAARKIIANCERSLKAACVSFPEIMLGCILDTAQELVNEDGYRWDVALAKATQIYPATKYAATGIFPLDA